MAKRSSVFMNSLQKVFIFLIGMLVLSACNGGDYLSGAAGVSGCNLNGQKAAINNGKAVIVADAADKTVRVIKWDDGLGEWSVEGRISPMTADAKQFKVPDRFLTTAYWFGIAGCQNWYSANELLSPLVADAGTSGGDPNDGPGAGDPVDTSESTDPSCLDGSTSDTTDCPTDSTGGGGGAYGD